jgi:hypothetical protein
LDVWQQYADITVASDIKHVDDEHEHLVELHAINAGHDTFTSTRCGGASGAGRRG